MGRNGRRALPCVRWGLGQLVAQGRFIRLARLGLGGGVDEIVCVLGHGEDHGPPRGTLRLVLIGQRAEGGRGGKSGMGRGDIGSPKRKLALLSVSISQSDWPEQLL